MPRERIDTTDPYAPPPMYHDKSGRMVRVGLMALLLAGLGVGYFAWSATTPQQTAVLAPVEQPAEQQVADNGYRVQPEQIPQAQPVAPTPQAAPAPERRAAPARAARSEPAPEVSTPPVSDTPMTPAPVPPASTTPQLPDATPPAVQG